MSLAPLLNAAPVIQLHAFAAIAALLLGIVQLAAPKGTLPHRSLGYLWATLMLTVAVSSLWIHTIDWWRGYSPIHMLSLLVLCTVPLGIWSARTGRISAHRKFMSRTFFTGLVIAGAFTFTPGRIMYRVLFGA